jgi:hypothetical protein
MLLFVTFFTGCNFREITFYCGDKGKGAPGERVHLDFYFFYLMLRGRGVEVYVFFFPAIYEKVEKGGGKGVHFGY